MLASIKSESSRTTVAADREFIQAKIRADVGFAKLDRMVFQVLESWIFRTLEIQTKLPKTLPRMQAKYLEALGEIHLTNRRLVQAKDYYTHADQIWRREKAPDIEDWEPLFQESLHHQQAELGPDNRNTVETMANYGVALQTAGDYAQAVELLTRAFETRERTCGSGDKLAIECLATLGQTLSTNGNMPKQRCGWSERTCKALFHLAIVYGMQNRFQDCLNMLLESYNSSVRTFGRDHLDTWQVLSKCAIVYCALGQYAESERVLLECQDKFKRVLGHDSEWPAKSLKLYYCQKHFEKAAPLTEMAYQALLGHNNPLILHTIYDMYLVKLEMQALETLDDLAALEEVLEKADCTDEIWKVHPCRGCFIQVQGRRFVCAECPTESRWYCASCVTDRKFTAFCPHDHWNEFIPPARFVLEKRLSILADASAWDEYDVVFEKYQAYCEQHRGQDRRERMLPSKTTFCCTIS
ncbi:hypothetical protein AeMF1_017717 [Aphanomyces euteiches]|nr:hypothetical protein AeMF1_017717 [Aphanomyces euteiches]KAH9180930.1 hypothetical protein AeNC1_017094 [Aphanomyces euteiches]